MCETNKNQEIFQLQTVLRNTSMWNKYNVAHLWHETKTQKNLVFLWVILISKLETIQSYVCRVSAMMMMMMMMMITINSKGFTGVQDLKEFESI